MKNENLKKLIKPFVYCYSGSGMLTNDYDEEAADLMAEKCLEILEPYLKESIIEINDKKHSEKENQSELWNEALCCQSVMDMMLKFTIVRK